MPTRQEKLNTLFKKLTADFLRDKAPRGVLVSVTATSVAANLANATIFLTVFPPEREEGVFNAIQKEKKGLREYLAAHTKMKRTPLIHFEIDKGEKNRQRIDELLLKS